MACLHAQLCPILCDPIDCSPPGSSVRGIFQARILEWVVIPFSRGSFRPRNWTWIFCDSCIGRQIVYYCTTWEASVNPKMSHPEQAYFWEQGEVKRTDCGKNGSKWVPAFKKDLKYDGNSDCMHTKITEDWGRTYKATWVKWVKSFSCVRLFATPWTVA